MSSESFAILFSRAIGEIDQEINQIPAVDEIEQEINQMPESIAADEIELMAKSSAVGETEQEINKLPATAAVIKLENDQMPPRRIGKKPETVEMPESRAHLLSNCEIKPDNNEKVASTSGTKQEDDQKSATTSGNDQMPAKTSGTKQENDQIFSDPQRYIKQYVPLHKAALKGEWKAAENLLQKDPTLATAHITERGETAFHIAAIQGHAYFVKKLLAYVYKSPSDLEAQNETKRTALEVQNKMKCTALCFAAIAGRADIADLMMKKNQELQNIRNEKVVVRPLYMAVWRGHKELAEKLFRESHFKSWDEEDQAKLLMRSIHSGLYALAEKIVKEKETLATWKNKSGETPLQVLVRKPFAFSATRRHGCCCNIASTILSYMKSKTSTAPDDAYTLFKYLRGCVSEKDVTTTGLCEELSKLLFIAAESGNDVVLVELISQYPDLVYKKNKLDRTIFHIAVFHRYVKVFNLTYELCGVKDIILSFRDTERNNILHLAGRLAPPDQLNSIPGAALQMQREVLWYKEIEKIVPPSYRNMKNSDEKTPHELFLAAHENLRKEGEKQMKQIAKSCMLLTTLIATVLLTSSLTVLGSDDSGAPSPRNEKLFMVSLVTRAIGTLASLTSMSMFLLVLVSRYADDDFLLWLPLYQVVGVVAFFVSLVAMMVAFCSYFLFFKQGLICMSVVLVLFLIVPLVFVILKRQLLINMVHCPCSSKRYFRSENRLFS